MRTIQITDKQPLVIVLEHPEVVFLFKVENAPLRVAVTLLKVHAREGLATIQLETNLRNEEP